MMDKCHSRGKKQRIRKKIMELKNPQDAATAPSNQQKQVKEAAISAKDRVSGLLKKREEKMERKDRQKGSMYTAEDRDIMKQSKNKKRQKRRDEAAEEDEFDSLFKGYKEKLEKKINEEDKKGTKKEPECEEIDID